MADVSQLLGESRLPLRTAARQEGRSYATILRWIDAGVRGVCLEAYRQGGRRYTTREALRRFTERTTNGFRQLTASETAARNRQIDVALARIAKVHSPTLRRSVDK